MAQDRSYLFVPGDRPDRFDKAVATGAHAVILDLEDAVAPDRKDLARDAVAAWLRVTSARVILRVNALDTPWYASDLALLNLSAVRGVMLPKAQEAAPLRALAARLLPGQTLVPLVETVAGWFAAESLARVPGVLRLAFGSVDFNSDAGIQGDGEELNLVRSQLVLVSRLVGLQPPIDGVTLAIDDVQALDADVRRSRRFGFGAKLCIHPRQVAGVHAAFRPTPAEEQWARRVVSAVHAGGLGAIAVDGKLVDKPVLLLAQELLAEVDAIAGATAA